MDGGIEAKAKNFPFQASIVTKSEINQVLCGAVIVSAHNVVTAAHCLDNIPDKKLLIRIGPDALKNRSDFYKVNKITIHEYYSPKILVSPFDIAIIEVKKPFTFGETVAPVKIFKRKEKLKRKLTARISGFGSNRLSNATDQLRFSTYHVVKNYHCKEEYGVGLKESQTCLESTNVGLIKDEVLLPYGLCQGDVGNPVIQSGRLAGIVTHGDACNEKFSIVIIEVGFFRDWIDRNLVHDLNELSNYVS